MKNCLSVLTYIVILFFYRQINAQVMNSGIWNNLGDVVVSQVFSDSDNGDGVGDGALFVDGISEAQGQGVTFTFEGTMMANETISISTYTFNVNLSYVRFDVELYNVNDSTVLASESVIIGGSVTTPENTIFNYNVSTDDVGDILQLRYIRTDPGETYRNFAIDNVVVNGQFISLAACSYSWSPDILVITSNATIAQEITTIVEKFSDSYLSNAPSATALNAANTDYDNLNISVVDGVITGTPITTFYDISFNFIRTYARHLKFNPNNTVIKEKFNNAIWFISKLVCDGTLAVDYLTYAYENFARPVVLSKNNLTPLVQDLFAFTFYEHTKEFEYFWEANYDASYQEENGAINTDMIYNLSDAMLAFVNWMPNEDERYRYMKGFQRWMNRFCTYTYGTADGLKKDGSGFHHWAAYDTYMYAFLTASDVLYYLSDSSFSVTEDSYRIFRDAVYAQFTFSNDSFIRPLSLSGRRPESRFTSPSKERIKRLAISGGNILELSSSDPIMAGLHNRVWGTDPELNYTGITSLEDQKGYYQFNHSQAGVYRSKDWIVVSKGFGDSMWGSEIYMEANRYGRYQSYGATEIMYTGNLETGNGFDVTTWDWNYNPGTTTIVLPWDKLHAERGRIDEHQEKSFVGALAFKNKNKEVLKHTTGSYGMFAMDFQEKINQGWSTVHGPNTHNNSFTFKKSTFAFDDKIICLGSTINNDDSVHPTVTTLYQRLDNTSNTISVNGIAQDGTASYQLTSDQWVLSNYNTGFYVFSGSGTLELLKRNQQTPNTNQIYPVDFSSNPKADYELGYINHGVNPDNDGYEYMVIPNSSSLEMQALQSDIAGGNKPYTVHQKDDQAHIVELKEENIWAYSFFEPNTEVSAGLIKEINDSALVMYEDLQNGMITLAINMPDLGFVTRAYTPAVPKTIKLVFDGDWAIANPVPNVSIITVSGTTTTLSFLLNDGLPIELSLVNNTLDTSSFVMPQEGFKLYPNPVLDEVTIAFEENKSGTISLIDITGVLLENKTFNDQKLSLNMKRYASGLYFIKLKENDGHTNTFLIRKY